MSLENAPKITVKQIPLTGEGEDKAFVTPKGTKLRAKLKLSHRGIMSPATVSNGEAAPTAFTLTLSMAELDENNNVKMEGGKYLIHDVHEIQFGAEALANPAFDIDTAIMQAIELKAIEAENIAVNRQQVMKSLKSKWGIDL